MDYLACQEGSGVAQKHTRNCEYKGGEQSAPHLAVRRSYYARGLSAALLTGLDVEETAPFGPAAPQMPVVQQD
jgi:hypothetical protein